MEDERNFSNDGRSVISRSTDLAAIAAGVEILIEECADVEFVEGIGLGLFWNFFGFGLQEIFVGCNCRFAVGSSVSSSRTGFAIIS